MTSQAHPFRNPIMYAGLMVWCIGLAAWAGLWFGPRDQALAAAVTLGAFLTAGKVVAITAGLSLHGNPWVIGAAVFLPDFGALLFFYPFTTTGIYHLGRWSRRIRESVDDARRRHENQQGIIARHGPWGLFLVSIIPVGFYSPLVISALGQVLGFRPRHILLPVGTAMLVMTTAWTLTLNASLDKAASLDPRLPLYLTVGLLVLFVGRSVLKRLFRRRLREAAPAISPADSPPPTGPR